MEENVIDTVTAGASVAATDFSIFGLFMQADLVVKIVILVLLLASFWSWAIIFDKVRRMRRLNDQYQHHRQHPHQNQNHDEHQHRPHHQQHARRRTQDM